MTHHFLRAGYLLRGGIEIGKVWHGKDNIIGPGYQEAYQLEANGNEPRVILGSKAAQLWKDKQKSHNRMCIARDDVIMVNGLHDYYIPEKARHGGIERVYKTYEATVDKTLKSSLPDNVKDKWSWFKSYLEDEGNEGRKWDK